MKSTLEFKKSYQPYWVSYCKETNQALNHAESENVNMCDYIIWVNSKWDQFMDKNGYTGERGYYNDEFLNYLGVN
jgi:hypothetical protein